jgi:hypothetical protein
MVCACSFFVQHNLNLRKSAELLAGGSIPCKNPFKILTKSCEFEERKRRKPGNNKTHQKEGKKRKA